MCKRQVDFYNEVRFDRAIVINKHKGKTAFRMSVNPEDINRVEVENAPNSAHIGTVNAMAEIANSVGIRILTVIMILKFRQLYSKLLDKLADELSSKVIRTDYIEVILMTYSYAQDTINTDEFPSAPFRVH